MRCAIPRGLLEAMNADPWDSTARLVAADWCAEESHSIWESQLRLGPPPLSLSFLSGDGYGNGDGYGYGNGDGDGDGNGDGYGNGDGNGYGNGDGNGKLKIGGRAMPEVEANQLIVLPHGWVICGFVAAQTGPYQFRVERASVICQTGGTPWDDLANGKGRDKATCRTWGTVTIGPQFVMSREWKGKLPSEGK